MKRVFIYARKSTDEAGRQARSLDAQVREATDHALRHNLIVIGILSESRSAKMTGRPVFNQMLDRIRLGEADGILAWHPNRLARNAFDGGVVIDMIDRAIIQHLAFVSYGFTNTPEGKMMLFNVFAQSKYEVDKLSVDTKRGHREKFLRGEWPFGAPLGYLNDKNTKTVVKDPDRGNLVQQLFILYGTGRYSLSELQEEAIASGLSARHVPVLTTGIIHRLIQKPFYYGMVNYNGEMRMGIHEPLISKELFDECQRVLKRRARPEPESPEGVGYRGFLRCGDCACAITTESQKGHVYYRCTKKRGRCTQPYLRYEFVRQQILNNLSLFVLSQEWETCLLRAAKQKSRNEESAGLNERTALSAQIDAIDAKIDELVELRSSRELTSEEFLRSKNRLVERRAELDTIVKESRTTASIWLEPVHMMIAASNRAAELQKQVKDFDLRRFFENLGSNPILSNRTIDFGLPDFWKSVGESGFFGPQAKPAPASDHEFSQIFPMIVHFLHKARTLCVSAKRFAKAEAK